jgi:F-type H+-transporting ATPase subunit delta
MIRIIAKRYAKALVGLSEEKKIIDKTRDDLAAFVAAVDSLPAIQKLFSSPVFTPENKKAVIKELSAKLGMHETTLRFIEHLAETGRIRYIKDVHEAFLALLAERQNRATVQLFTAATVNAAELEEIRKKLESLTGKKVDINSQVDAALIGGAKARVGSVIYDGTIKNQLSKMRNQLSQ